MGLWKEYERSWCEGALQIRDQTRLDLIISRSTVRQCGGEQPVWRAVVELQDQSRKAREVADVVAADARGMSGCRG